MSQKKSNTSSLLGFAYWAPIALATAILLPILWQGMFTDDWLFLKALRSPVEGQPPLWDMYRLMPVEAETIQAYRSTGDLPWWTDPQLRIAFLRPIPSLLMALDNALWGDMWLGYHLHSLFWHTVFLFSGALTIRAITNDPKIARWATWIFCLENAHFVTAGWWSNRHALIAGSFALFGLWAYLRHKRLLSLVCFALALASGELALAVFGFLIALLVFPRSSRRAEWRAAWPHLLLFLVYATAYVLLSRGVSGSSFYLDPLHATWDYVLAFPQRWLILFGEMFHQIPSDLAFLGFGSWLLVLGAAVLIWVWRSPKSSFDWVLLGAALSLLPAVGAPPSGRMLLVASLGSAVWLANRLNAFQESRRLWGRLIWAWTLIIPPLLGLGMLYGQHQASHLSESTAARSLDLCAADRDVWILNPPDHIVGVYLSLLQDQSLKQPRQSIRALSIGPRTIEHRLIDGTLEMRSDVPFLSGELERFWNRNPDLEFFGPNGLHFSVSDKQMTAVYPGLGTDSGPCLLLWADSRLVLADSTPDWKRVERSPSPSGL